MSRALWTFIGIVAAGLLLLAAVQWFLLPADNQELLEEIQRLETVAENLEARAAEQENLRHQAAEEYQQLLGEEQQRSRQAEERIGFLEEQNRRLQDQREDLRQDTDDQVAALPDMEDVALAAMVREKVLDALQEPITFEPVGLMFQTNRAGAEAIAESLVEWSACRQELGIVEEQLSNWRGQVTELESIADSWELQHDSAMMMVETANEELKVRDQLEENLRQRLEAERIRAEKAEGKLFWKQLEWFLQGAAVGGVVGVLVK